MKAILTTQKQICLSVSRDFDTRWIGELPIAFEGTPSECTAFALARGCDWIPDDSLLFGGRFEHPDNPLTYYPT